MNDIFKCTNPACSFEAIIPDAPAKSDGCRCPACGKVAIRMNPSRPAFKCAKCNRLFVYSNSRNRTERCSKCGGTGHRIGPPVARQSSVPEPTSSENRNGSSSGGDEELKAKVFRCRCPACGGKNELKASSADSAVTCRICKSQFFVPEEKRGEAVDASPEEMEQTTKEQDNEAMPPGEETKHVTGRTRAVTASSEGKKPSSPPYPWLQTEGELTESDTVLSVCFTPDGRCVVTGSDKGAATLWDSASGRCLGNYQCEIHGMTLRPQPSVRSVCVSADGSLLVTGSGGYEVSLGTLIVWPIRGGLHRIIVPKGTYIDVAEIDMSPDGRFVLAGLSSDGVHIWDLQSEAKERFFLMESRRVPTRSQSVTSVCFSTDGSLVLCASGDVVEVCKLTGWIGRSWLLKGHTKCVRCVRVTKNGRYAVTASDDTTLRLWDYRSGRCIRTFEGHSNCVYAVAVSSDSRFAISAGWDATLRLWDLETGKCLDVYPDQYSIQTVAISPDGSFAVAGGSGGKLVRCDLRQTTERGSKEVISCPKCKAPLSVTRDRFGAADLSAVTAAFGLTTVRLRCPKCSTVLDATLGVGKQYR